MIYIVGKPDMKAADLAGLSIDDSTADILRASDLARALARTTGEQHSVFKLVEVTTFTGRKKEDIE